MSSALHKYGQEYTNRFQVFLNVSCGTTSSKKLWRQHEIQSSNPCSAFQLPLVRPTCAAKQYFIYGKMRTNSNNWMEESKARQGQCGWRVLSEFLTVIITHSQAQLSTCGSHPYKIQQSLLFCFFFFFFLFLPLLGLAFERCTLICHFRQEILWCSIFLCFTATNQTFQTERVAYGGKSLQLAADRLLTRNCI